MSMLSDDVLRCLGILTWLNGSPLLMTYINYPHLVHKWLSNIASSVYECIYKRGNWRHSCGSEVEAMIVNLTKSFTNLAKSNDSFAHLFTKLQGNICNICEPGFDLTKYDKLNNLRDR